MYKLIIDKKASKYIDTLDKPTRKRILDALLELKENPYSASNVRKLIGYTDYYRKRVGDYRIIYRIKHNELIVTILKIDSRGDVYKSY